MTSQTYNLDGPKEFPFPYPVRSADQLTVEIVPGAAVAPGDYEVVGVGPTSTQVTVRYPNAPTSGGLQLKITRYVAPERVTQIDSPSDINVTNLNAEFNNVYEALTDFESYILDLVQTEVDAAIAAKEAAEEARDQAVQAEQGAQAAWDGFRDRYWGAYASDPSTSPTGNPPDTGDLYWNTTAKQWRVWNGTAWQQPDSAVPVNYDRQDYIATASQTTFAVDYDAPFVQVWVNGALIPPSDYTAVSGTDVVLDEGVPADTEVTVIGLGATAVGVLDGDNATVSTSTGTQLLPAALDKRVVHVPDIAALRALTGLQDGQRVSVTGYFPDSSVGGGEFSWEGSASKSDHDGKFTISPTVPWDGQSSTVSDFKNGSGETDPGGSGCFVALSPTPAEREALSSSVNLANEVRSIAGAPDQMFAAKDADGALLVGFQRGARMTQYSMSLDPDALMQLRSAKIGPAVLSPGGVGRFNQVMLDGAFNSAGANYYTTTVGDSFSGQFNGAGAFLHSYRSPDGGVWRFVIDQDPALTFDVSTYSDPADSPSALLIVSGLGNKTHNFTAQFIGDDPDNPPASGTARGWLRYDPSEPMTIEDSGVFEALGPSPNQFTVALDGTYISSGQNYYTTTVGDSFSFEFTGEGFDFSHVADTRGGIWEFVVDAGSPITVSTYGDGGVDTTRVVDGLTNETHEVVATFQGADPENPPSDGTARGWLRYDPSEPVTGTSFPRISGGTAELLAATSILEWAIRARPLSEPGWEPSWSPRHSGDSDISRDVSTSVTIDGTVMTSDLEGLTENYLPVRSVVVDQSYVNYSGSDSVGSSPMWDGTVRHQFTRDGACRFSHEFIPRQDLYCPVGYAFMLGASPTVNAIDNGALESFSEFEVDNTLVYSEIAAGARATYQGEGDRYMFAVQSLTPASAWRLDSISRMDRLFYTNVRTDAVKTYIRGFWDEVLEEGRAYRVSSEYMLGEQ